MTREERDSASRMGVGHVDPNGFIYQAEMGRVLCPRCGKFALSRSGTAIRIWKDAHSKWCSGRTAAPAIRAA